MTKEEAIKELEILKEDYWDDDGYGHETKQYDDTMLALDMAIGELNQSWIPVAEEMPKEHICDDGFIEPSVSVLVQLNNKEMKVSRYWGSRERYKDKPWIDLSYPTTLEVVAWMPLPESYKTESEE